MHNSLLKKYIYSLNFRTSGVFRSRNGLNLLIFSENGMTSAVLTKHFSLNFFFLRTVVGEHDNDDTRMGFHPKVE